MGRTLAGNLIPFSGWAGQETEKEPVINFSMRDLHDAPFFLSR